MSSILALVVVGIATGAVYGLAGSGLVLTYKTSGIFNFGHGAIATASAYCFYWLSVDLELSWILALLISVGVVGPLAGLVFEKIASRLIHQSMAYRIVGTVGVILVVQGIVSIIFGTDTLYPPKFLPGSTESFTLFGAVITYDKVIITAIATIAVALLYALFRWTRIGLAMRAVVDDPNLLAMQATNPDAVRRLSWIIGASFAGMCGVLIAPLIGLNPILLTFLIVDAFGAAVIGAFSSIPLTFLGGLFIGVAASVSTYFVLNVPWMVGIPSSIPFIVLFVALFIIPKRKLVPLSRIAVQTVQQYRAPTRVRIGAAFLVVIPLLFVPQLVGVKLGSFTIGILTALLLLSLGLLVRTSGQISLCHAAFAAIGAVAFSQFAVDHQFPWLLALLLGGLVTMAVGALVAIPAIRLSGLFLALSTLGFGILVERLLYGQSWMFTSLTSGRTMPRPSFAEDDTSYYYFALAALVVTALIVVFIQRSRLGRVLQGMSGSSTAMTALGLSTHVSKVIVFCISAFFAGIAGALLGAAQGYSVSTDSTFQPFNSLVLLAALAIAPFVEPWYALVGGASAVMAAYISGPNTALWINFLFGAGVIAIAMRGGTPPMPEGVRRILDRLGPKRTPDTPPPPTAHGDLVAPVDAGDGIAVSSLSVHFGGLVAVSDVSFDAPMGQITGLIGPNGAGKTTTFNVCSGLNRRAKGRVALHGHDVTGLSPSARGRLGMGRTFQRVELCDSLDVLQNVMLGREASAAGANLVSHLLTRPSTRRITESAAWEALRDCGITNLAHRPAGELSTGQRRLVELARLLAGHFDMLLLDEPSSGLDPEETVRFGDLLQRIVAERGVGILLVEHDMELVMRICAHLYVMDAGAMLFHGLPADVAASPVVRSAYLGDDVAGIDDLTAVDDAIAPASAVR